MNRIGLSLLVACLWSMSAPADELLVAAASNFSAPMNELVLRFEAQTDHTVEVAFGSSGRLFAQISNGAPFQIFFLSRPG
jgi:ABC-type molybdate transport system substrate-binding protein